MGTAQEPTRDGWASLWEKIIWAHYWGNLKTHLPEETQLNWEMVICLAENTFLTYFLEKHIEENVEPNVTVTSALMSSPHLMSATLYAKWMTWTVITPPKVYLHDQKMVGESADGTSIRLNLAKNKITGRGGWWL